MIPKFRALIKEAEYIVDVETIHFELGVVKVNGIELYQFEDVILMQSTGLRDENGVEIFEGDIVNINHTFRNPMTGCGTLTLNKNFEVVYINGMFTRDGSSMGLSRDLIYLTVIGNVHENQELLEDV